MIIQKVAMPLIILAIVTDKELLQAKVEEIFNTCAQAIITGADPGPALDNTWYYRFDPEAGSGSRAWVRAQSFANWLLSSRRGQRIARGTFQEINQPSAKFPRGGLPETT